MTARLTTLATRPLLWLVARIAEWTGAGLDEPSERREK